MRSTYTKEQQISGWRKWLLVGLAIISLPSMACAISFSSESKNTATNTPTATDFANAVRTRVREAATYAAPFIPK